MKSALILALSMFAVGASAAPCFHPGTYKGKGIGQEPSGKIGVYDVETEITDSSSGTTNYKWPGGGNATLNFHADNGKLQVDGKDAGTAECGMAAQNLNMSFEDIQLIEEWSFTGNYLLRFGTKVQNGQKVVYQELLYRQ
jgi:hypothetical protein